MITFARLQTKYRYEGFPQGLWDGHGNIGDCFQNFAVEHLYRKLGIRPEELILVNRDELPEYDGPKCILPMQGWYDFQRHFLETPPWSGNIVPVFLGFHYHTVASKRLKAETLAYFRSAGPIGCRDRMTRNYFLSRGVNAYFSACMTLTFPKRDVEPTCGKVFLIDLPSSLMRKVPASLKRDAEIATQLYKFSSSPPSDEEIVAFENHARSVLAGYRDEARLVVTSRIHAAMPCVAMGIPTIFIHNNIHDRRFDVLRGVVPVHTSFDRIDWEQPAANIDEYKKRITNNALSQIIGKADEFSVALPRQPDRPRDGLQEPGSQELLNRYVKKIDMDFKNRTITLNQKIAWNFFRMMRLWRRIKSRLRLLMSKRQKRK